MGSVDRDIINDKWGITNISPDHCVKEIIAPLLLVVGDKDTVVPAEQSYRMYDQRQKAKKPVEFLTLPDGEHWRTIEIKKLTAIERFLEANLSI